MEGLGARDTGLRGGPAGGSLAGGQGQDRGQVSG